MHVKNNKASFLAGNSKISIKAWLETWNNRRNGEPPDFLTDYKDPQIREHDILTIPNHQFKIANPK